MAYATQADLVARFGADELARLTDETAATSIDAAEVTAALDEASSLIDAYLSTRYTVPLSPVPTMVRHWCCALARKALWKERALPGEVVAANADAALGQLKDVAKGLAGLPGADGVQATSTGGFAYTQPSAVFDTTGLL